MTESTLANITNVLRGADPPSRRVSVTPLDREVSTARDLG